MKLSTVRNIIRYHAPCALKAELIKLNPACFSVFALKPLTASLALTSKCMLRCDTCAVWQDDSGNELSTVEWENILRQLQEEGVNFVNFTGGEPLMRYDMAELIAYASKLHLRTVVATNGMLLKDEVIDALLKSGIDGLAVSIDALGEAFDLLRQSSGAFEKVQFACERLAEKRKARPFSVSIQTTIMKKTLPQVMDVVRFAEDFGFSVFFNLLDFTPVFFKAARNDALWPQAPEQQALEELVFQLIALKKKKPRLIRQSFSALRYIKDYFQDPLQKKIPCVKSLTRIFIGSQGDVYGGCWSMASFGNLRKISLRQIMQNSDYLKAHRKMFFKECPGCSCGYQTDLQYSLPNLAQEALCYLRGG